MDFGWENHFVRDDNCNIVNLSQTCLLQGMTITATCTLFSVGGVNTLPFTISIEQDK